MAGFNLGDIFVTFKAKTDGLDSAIKNVKDKIDQVDEGTQKVSSSMSKMGVVIGAISGIVSSVFNKAVQVLSNTIGDAVKRVDTLNNSSRAFENMGFKVGDTKKAMDLLDKSIRGLPTSLDSAVRGMTLIAASTNDVGKSQKIWSALNDGILGFGGSTAMVDNATIQLSQDLAGGRITAQTWLSLLNSGFGPALNGIARQMGITTTALKNGLGDGSISVDQFTDSLISLDTKGGGGMKSLQKIAKDSTSGISTGWQNAQTAITRGIAEIIKAIGSGNISGSIASIGDAAEKMFKSIAGIIKFISDNKDVFSSLAVGIGAATTAMILFNAVMVIQEWITAFSVLQLGVGAFLQLESASKLVTAAQWLLNAALDANPIGIIILAVAGLVAGLIFFFTQTQLGRAILAGFFSFVIDGWNNISRFFREAINNIVNGWNGLTAFIGGIPGKIGGFFASVANAIFQPFKTAFNWVADAWNNTVGKLSWKVPNWVPGIGGNSIGAPKLPHFSSGIENFAGGLAYVHGGEVLANLAPGTSVIPKKKVDQMSVGGGGVKVYGNINIDSPNDADYFFSRIDRNVKLEKMGLSPAS